MTDWSQPGPHSDAEVLDRLAAELDSTEPFPETAYLRIVRMLLRETGRKCDDPVTNPDPDPSPPSGY